ncbi:phytoene/squalene synthase family protein [Nocardia amamiensis]|uniref:Phytoene/squalene synthase family protein n=1 Tax=Nocardia amamiensis TaxID=404578 RepID=A0ABS0CXP7_9NOCA|nr:phytoene/squalene synthase family protein [Nocardia amamiensis]MBF6301377.1 phytoene/squalene synthase family protein [Nocardia amamiensis]
MSNNISAADRRNGARLRDSYRACRALNARHGRTFFLATRLLAADQRPAIHALYGFARRADDILDEIDPTRDTAERAARLDTLAEQLRTGDSQGEVILPAVLHTARAYRIPYALFESFLDSMRMDLTITDYPDRRALDRYIHGSAEVIGLQVLPVLGTVSAMEDAAPYAAALGKAFQLTNFLRDVDEDLARDRVYLPADELAAYGVDRDLLHWCQAHRRTDPRVRRALAAQHALTREIYTYARDGVALLEPRSRPCVAAAHTLYSEILHRIEDLDFEIFVHRARVGIPRRAAVGASGFLRAWRARRNVPRRDNTIAPAALRSAADREA